MDDDEMTDFINEQDIEEGAKEVMKALEALTHREPVPTKVGEALAAVVANDDKWGPESRANLLFYAERIATLMRDPSK